MKSILVILILFSFFSLSAQTLSDSNIPTAKSKYKSLLISGDILSVSGIGVMTAGIILRNSPLNPVVDLTGNGNNERYAEYIERVDTKVRNARIIISVGAITAGAGLIISAFGISKIIKIKKQATASSMNIEIFPNNKVGLALNF